MVDRGASRRGGLVGDDDVAVAKDFEVPVIVRRDHRFGEEVDGVLAKVRRDIADAQPPVGRAIVGVSRRPAP